MITLIPDCLNIYEGWIIAMLNNYGFVKKSELARFYDKDPSNVNRNKTPKTKRPRK